jgi:hypothetical protein
MVNNIDNIQNSKTRNVVVGHVRSQSEQRRGERAEPDNEYNFTYNINSLNAIDRSRDIGERGRGERNEDRQGSDRYVPQINSKKQSPENNKYKTIVEDLSKIMGVYFINLE